jgi:hypothetical protein
LRTIGAHNGRTISGAQAADRSPHRSSRIDKEIPMRGRPYLAWVTICVCLALIVPGIAGAGVVAPRATDIPVAEPCDDPAAPFACADEIPDSIIVTDPTNAPDCDGLDDPFVCADDTADGVIVAGDRDGDGLNDDLEEEIGSNPDNPDTDGDDLRDDEEARRGTLFDDADTDGDNASDGFEVQAGTDPLDPTDKPAVMCGPDSMFACAGEVPDSIIVIVPTNAPDCDGLDDPFVCANDTADGVILAGDRDGDGLDDATEDVIGTDPDNPDTDGNGLPDGYCMPQVDDTDGDGIDDSVFVCAGYDFDGDGLSDAEEIALGTNFLVTDTDGDKVSDGVEVKEGKNPLDPTDNPTPEAPAFGPDSTPVEELAGTEPVAVSTPDDDGIVIELATEAPDDPAGG